MSASNKTKVLILSAPTDLHARAVGEELDRLGVGYKIWRGEDFLRECKFRFSLDSGEQETLLSFMDGDTIDLNQLTSIWFRRPGSARSMTMPEPWIERMMESESASTLGGIFRGLPCLLVNHPGRDTDCLHKLWQLEAAKRVGFSVPETIVTNDPDTVRNFAAKHNNEVVYKFVGETGNRYFPPEELAIGIPTMQLRTKDLAHLDQVRFGPHLFQRAIQKHHEVRVTAIGKKLFAGKIDSQARDSSGKTDWRLDYTVPMETVQLPGEIAQACIDLLAVLQLNYGAIDLCVGDDGQYVFLECNCAGQYLWIEARTDLKISSELARLLAGLGEPITLGYEKSSTVR